MGKNVTLTLPEETIRRARHLAVERGLSLSRLLSEYMEEMVLREERYERAGKRSKERMRRGLSLGTNGRAGWSREELHER